MQSPLGASSGSNTGINSVRMRFADVLLMYAEQSMNFTDRVTMPKKH